MLDELAQLTALEWAVVAIATAICLLGSLLPKIGNLLGRLFMGEDPLLARWQQQRLERRRAQKAEAVARREAKRARKAGAADPAGPPPAAPEARGRSS